MNFNPLSKSTNGSIIPEVINEEEVKFLKKQVRMAVS